MKEKLTTVGSMVTALLAAGCCIGPALFLAFGITSLGFLSMLEPLRPYLLGLTFVLVAVAYYYAYGRGSNCGTGPACKEGSQGALLGAGGLCGLWPGVPLCRRVAPRLSRSIGVF